MTHIKDIYKESKKHLNDVKMARFQHFKFAYGILIELKKADQGLVKIFELGNVSIDEGEMKIQPYSGVVFKCI